jgi:sarcosine oxidase subunit gamma
MADLTLAARPPFAVAAGRHGRDLPVPGLCLEVLKPRATLLIMARRNKRADLAQIMQSRFGVALPDGPVVARGEKVSLLWAGRLQWLALAEQDAVPNLKAEMQAIVKDVASLSDQSDARVTVAVSGPKARDTLAKLTPIDLHPRCFVPLQTALTLFGYLTGQITQIDDTPSYQVIVFRSFAESFWRSINAAGAEFGIDVVAP